MKELDDTKWLMGAIKEAIPNVAESNMIEWATTNVRLVGSVRSESFDIEITPWLRKAYEAVDNSEVEALTLLFSAQSGKSAFGETLICYWIATKATGDIQYNWENDEKGKLRWKKRVKRILEACKPVKKLMPKNVSESRPTIAFDHLSFSMQGIHNTDNLESESVTLQVNEEQHAWEPGRKRLADKRLGAVWNRFQANISTGGKVDDQLDETFKDSSQENWEEPCDSCGKYQHFRAKTYEGKLGGLHHETTKKENGEYDFDAIEKTIYYECEHCGHKMYDDYERRRQRSLKGRYPNEGFAKHVGLHAEAVSVYWVKYIDIVKEKLLAIAAMRRGDKAPWIVYIQRTEGGMYDPRFRPHLEDLRLNLLIKKGSRLENPELCGMTVDKQRGRLVKKGELPHYWAVVRDWISPMRSRLAWEGKLTVDEEIEELRLEYGAEANRVLVDSGYNATDVYKLCYKYGYTAIKGENNRYWIHNVNGKKTRRIYSPIQWVPIDGKKGESIHEVPLILYSKHEIRERLDAIRRLAGDRYEIPKNVSKDYKAHMVAEERRQIENTKTGEMEDVWILEAADKRNDLLVCECYQTLLVDLCDLQNLPEDEIAAED